MAQGFFMPFNAHRETFWKVLHEMRKTWPSTKLGPKIQKVQNCCTGIYKYVQYVQLSMSDIDVGVRPAPWWLVILFVPLIPRLVPWPHLQSAITFKRLTMLCWWCLLEIGSSLWFCPSSRNNQPASSMHCTTYSRNNPISWPLRPASKFPSCMLAAKL